VNAATKRHPRYLTVNPNAPGKRVFAITKDLNENDRENGENDDGGGGGDGGGDGGRPDVKSWLLSEVNHDGVCTYGYILLITVNAHPALPRSITCAGDKANHDIFLIVDDQDRVRPDSTLLKVLLIFSATGQMHRSESFEQERKRHSYPLLMTMPTHLYRIFRRKGCGVCLRFRLRAMQPRHLQLQQIPLQQKPQLQKLHLLKRMVHLPVMNLKLTSAP
jgi:hypothetical protein